MNRGYEQPLGERSLLRAAGIAANGIAWAGLVLIGLEVLFTAGSSSKVVPALEKVVGPICHHLPDRSFSMPSGNGFFPVCSRCTGLYAGWVFGVIFGAAVGQIIVSNQRLLKVTLATVLLATGLAVFEAVSERLGLLVISNPARAIAGGGLGVLPALALMLGGCLATGESRQCSSQVSAGSLDRSTAADGNPRTAKHDILATCSSERHLNRYPPFG